MAPMMCVLHVRARAPFSRRDPSAFSLVASLKAILSVQRNLPDGQWATVFYTDNIGVIGGATGR